MMSDKRSLYLVPSSLDAPTRIIGLTLDEFVPTFSLAVFFFILGERIFAILIPAIVFAITKLLKQGQGSAWLINICYWYFPRWLVGGLFRRTPASEDREYIA